MNYIKQLTYFFNKSTADPNFTPTHMSLFIALFQCWNQARFPKKIQIIRDDIMRLAKINSKATYHKAMTYLHKNAYIEYKPSYNPLKGSEIGFFPPTNIHSKTNTEPVQNLSTRPLNEPYNKQTTNIIKDNISPRASSKKDTSDQKLIRLKNQDIIAYTDNPRQIPPQIFAVEEFFISNKSTLQEAQKFLNHYTANGWLVGGRSPMLDWKASAKNWIANSSRFNKNANSNATTRPQQLHTTPNKNYFEPL